MTSTPNRMALGAGLTLAFGLLVLSAAQPVAAQTPGEFTPDHVSPPADQDEAPAEPEHEPASSAGDTGEGDSEDVCPTTQGETAGGNATSIIPDDCWGRFPSSHYDIGCDEGAWNHITRKIYCAYTDLAFQGARTTTATALWLIEWTYGFGVYHRLGDPMIDVADSYQRQLVGPFGLDHLAWTYAIAWCAIAGLRGRLTMAAGELVTSIVLAGLAGVLLANPAGYLQGAFDTMNGLSGAVLTTGSGQPPPDNPDQAQLVLAPLQTQIHQAFVEDPYDHLNWGGPLSGRCAETRDQILADGPHETSDEPRDQMSSAGCQDQADFNHDPSGQRLFGAVLTFVAAVVVVVLIVLIAVTILIAQVVAVVLFAVAPLAALGAVLPGSGREIAWRWVAAMVRVGLVVVGMSFVLSLMLLSIQALLADQDAGGLIERFMLVNLVVVGMFIARKRVVTAGTQLAGQLAGRLSTRRAGGDHAPAWLGPAAAGGVSGFALGASLGLDPRSRSGRLASFATRDHMADRRLRRHHKRSERRAQQPVARERTELITNSEGDLVERRSVTIDGPALDPGPTDTRRARYGIGASARARRTRNKIEAHARDRARELPPQTRWPTSPPHKASSRSPAIDPEEA